MSTSICKYGTWQRYGLPSLRLKSLVTIYHRSLKSIDPIYVKYDTEGRSKSPAAKQIPSPHLSIPVGRGEVKWRSKTYRVTGPKHITPWL